MAAPASTTERDLTRAKPGAQTFVVAGLVALPVLVAAVSLVGYHWHPASDLALEVLGIRDVGGRHTPLVGVQSRFDYYHPGPLLFWLLSPFEWVFGNTGILVGAAIVNGAAIVGSVFAAHRRGGPPLAVMVGLATALLVRGMGPDLLVDPWNPWIVVMPFLLTVLLAWSVADGDWPVLPWFVGVGSFVVQGHVGYAPLVLGLGVLAGVLGFLAGRPPRRWVVIAAVVGGLLWLAPVVQQLTGSPGNLGEIVDALRDPVGARVGWASAFGIVGRQLSPVPPFVAGRETTDLDLLATSSTLPAIALALVCAVLGVFAWRRGAHSTGRLATLAVTAASLSVLATSRIQGLPVPYLVRWAWVVAALVWVSILWSLWSLVPHGAATRAAVYTGIAAIGVLSLATTSRAVGTRPYEEVSDAIGALGAGADARLDPDARYRVDWLDRNSFGAAGIGVFTELEGRGVPVRVEPSLSHAFGSWRTARRSDVDAALTVVSGADLDAGWRPPPAARLVASYDPLTRQERARYRRLERKVRDQIDAEAGDYLLMDSAHRRDVLVERGADREVVDELGGLVEQGDRYRVYAGPA